MNARDWFSCVAAAGVLGLLARVVVPPVVGALWIISAAELAKARLRRALRKRGLL
jgi:hypothetical protein